MIKVFIRPINTLIKFDSNIKKCNIESQRLFRELVLNTNQTLVLSIKDIPLDLERKSIILYNPFELKINDQKNLKYLYKKLDETIKKQYVRNVYEIESEVFNLIELIANDFDLPLDYNENLDLQKIFSAVGLEYKEPATYIEKLVYYFKLLKEINNYTLIVTFGLLNILEKEEIQLLEKELIINELYLLDFNLSHNNISADIIIDQDWCII